jgi:hypothetical protein
MKWRKFFIAVLPWGKKYRTPSDGLQQIYNDAMVLAKLIYDDRPRSRRALAKKVPHHRWTQAYQALKSFDIIDSRGQLIYEIAPDLETAEWRVRQGLMRRREMMKTPTFIPKWKTLKK